MTKKLLFTFLGLLCVVHIYSDVIVFDQGYFCYETDGSEASAIIKSYCIPGKKSCGTITIPATVSHQNLYRNKNWVNDKFSRDARACVTQHHN